MVHQPAPAIPDLQPQLLDFGAAVAAGGDAQLLAPAQAQQEQVPELQQQQQQQGSNDNAAGGVGHGNVMGFGGFGVDAVQYQQYAGDEESSDDEVDVASLGFTPLSLSTAPMSPISVSAAFGAVNCWDGCSGVLGWSLPCRSSAQLSLCLLV